MDNIGEVQSPTAEQKRKAVEEVLTDLNQLSLLRLGVADFLPGCAAVQLAMHDFAEKPEGCVVVEAGHFDDLNWLPAQCWLACK